MPTELATLGDHVFRAGSAAYAEMRRIARYRWEPQDRIGRTPARQWLGPGGETIEFSGVIYPVARTAAEELESLRGQALRGEPLHLQLGTGETLGLWSIERIDETGSLFLPGGVPRKSDFRIRLVWYGEDLSGGPGNRQVAYIPSDVSTGLTQDLPGRPFADLAANVPVEVIPAELPTELAESLPPELPEGLADGRSGTFGSVLSTLSEGRSVGPRLLGRLQSEVAGTAGRLGLDRSYLAQVTGAPGLPDRDRLLQLAQSRVDALETVLRPPEAAIRHIKRL